jgi:hypothetical protein
MIKRKGQNLIEYCVFICCLVAALIAMQVYVKRGIQGRLRQSADDVGEQFDANSTTGYVTYSVSGTTGVTTWLQLVDCTEDQEEHKCIDGYLDLDGDGNITSADFSSIAGTGMGDSIYGGTPEVTTRTGREDIGPAGGLYD